MQDNFTIMLWFKRNTPGSPQSVFSKMNNETGGWNTYIAGFGYTGTNLDNPDNAELIFAMQYKGPNIYPAWSWQNVMNDTNWHHLVIVKNATTGTYRDINLYIDGVIRNASRFDSQGYTSSFVLIYDTSFNLSIGKRIGHEHYLNGSIDEFKIINYALDGNEINLSMKSKAGRASMDTILSSYANFTNLPDFNYSFIVHVNDTSGRTNTTGYQWVFIDTVAPVISFETPTPNNQTLTYIERWAFINVSILENNTVDTILLEWSGVNESMTKVNNTHWFVNKTLTLGVNYTFKVWANDFANNFGVSATRWVMTPAVNMTLEGTMQGSFIYELGTSSIINVTSAYTSVVCLSIDAIHLWDNFTCGNNSISYNFTTVASNVYFSDRNRSRILSFAVAEGKTMSVAYDNRSEFVTMAFILNGTHGNPKNVKIDIDNNSIIDYEIVGYLNNTIVMLNFTALNETTANVNFTQAGARTQNIRIPKNATVIIANITLESLGNGTTVQTNINGSSSVGVDFLSVAATSNHTFNISIPLQRTVKSASLNITGSAGTTHNFSLKGTPTATYFIDACTGVNLMTDGDDATAYAIGGYGTSGECHADFNDSRISEAIGMSIHLDIGFCPAQITAYVEGLIPGTIGAMNSPNFITWNETMLSAMKADDSIRFKITGGSPDG